MKADGSALVTASAAYIYRMHWLDRIGAMALHRTRPEQRIFHGGWGDHGVIDEHLALATDVPELDPIEPVIGERVHHRGVARFEISFPTPHHDLPVDTGTARALVVMPDGADRVSVLMSAWNDEGYAKRSLWAAPLAEHGIGLIMPETPFYGSRRIAGRQGIAIPTVADFMQMGRAVVLEGRAMADWGGRTLGAPGVSGFSMGGNLAAFISTLSDQPLATAVLAGAHSPGPVFLNGVLRSVIDWEALGGPSAEERLAQCLFAASVLRFAAPHHTKAAIVLAGTIDGFIPTSAVQAVHRHWRGSEMRWVRAGHASLLSRHRRSVIRAIVDSFDRVEQLVGDRR